MKVHFKQKFITLVSNSNTKVRETHGIIILGGTNNSLYKKQRKEAVD